MLKATLIKYILWHRLRVLTCPRWSCRTPCSCRWWKGRWPCRDPGRWPTWCSCGWEAVLQHLRSNRASGWACRRSSSPGKQRGKVL